MVLMVAFSLKRATTVEDVAPPTQQELDIIWAEIDPGGFST